MKRFIYILFVFLIGVVMSGSISSCKTGYGCPAEEQYKNKQAKPLSKKRGESRLFKEK
jgi:hypothetical protein